MAMRITHRAKLLAMELTITAMQHTRSSHVLTRFIRWVYHLISNEQFILAAGSILAFAIAGFLIGYLSFFLIR